ncbi:MAG TPA: hypothetical protein VFI53_03370 [Myxococcaceae bacterium]|nr:hypothetical protein [Myxococcaceae bacterium]
MRREIAIAEGSRLLPDARDRSLGLAFVLLLSLPALIGLEGNEAGARARAGEPPVKLVGVAAAGGIGPWLQQLQTWARASFGGRHQLVEWDAQLKDSLGLSRSYGSDVTEGKDGWMFYRVHRGTQGVHPELPFPSAELDLWVRSLQAIRRRVEARGATFLVVIAPDKQTLYPDLLPPELAPPRPVSRLDALTARLRGLGVRVVDVRPALREGRASGSPFSRWPLYWKTDTHWNSLGALLAARAVLVELQQQFPGVHVPTDEEVQVETHPEAAGDLVRMRGLQDVSGDLRVETRLNPERCPEVHGYDLYTHPEVIQRLSCPGAPVGRALISHDSMMVAMLPVLAPAFERSTWSRQPRVEPALLEAEAPEVVIFEVVERTLWEGLPTLWGKLGE